MLPVTGIKYVYGQASKQGLNVVKAIKSKMMKCKKKHR